MKGFQMFDLNPEDMLSKIHQYRIDRPDGWCYISVHEVVESERAKIRFIAVPNIGVQQAEKQYFGTGENMEDALSDCLSKIKTFDIKTIIPDIEIAYGQNESENR